MDGEYKENQRPGDEWYFTPQEPEKPDSSNKKELSNKKRFWISFILGAAVCAAVIFGVSFILNGGGSTVKMSKSDYEYYQNLDSNFGKYNQILEMIGEDPLAETTPEAVTDDKLKELVASIGDPYAEYYTPEEFKEFEKHYASDYVGVGIVVAQNGDDILILSIFKDGPAEGAGMQPGDKILKVDGEKPEDMNDAVNRITGVAGTPVTITIDRDGKEMELNMKREKIEQESVAYKQLDEDKKVGYIEILTFREGTADSFKMAVKDLKKKGCEKFIVDLRDNGGGLTDESIQIADYLLPECRIMSEKTKSGEETVYNSKASSAELDMVVLVNENTASASEILSGAIQDNNAAKIIGTKTFGKGVTQISHQFEDGSAIKITITEYFRPSGKTVHGVGITPDIEATGDDVMTKALEELNK